MSSRRHITRIILAAAAVASATSGAQAQEARSNIGTLTCTTSQADTTPNGLADTRRLRCSFRPTESGVEEVYAGTLREISTGKAAEGKLVLIWVVSAPPEPDRKAGFLAQTYVGQGGSITPSAPAPPALIGQSDSKITLRQIVNDPGGETPAITVIELEARLMPA